MDWWTAVPGLGFTLYKNRAELQSIWNKLVTKTVGGESTIGITGGPGVGKTVLLDHLSGTAYKHGYIPPGRSVKGESRKLKQEDQRYTLSVIPGQDSPQRHDSIDSLFGGNKRVDGIIHVVCNGYATYRDLDARAALEQQGIDTVEKLRQVNLELEIDDFKTTAQAIRGMVRKKKNRPWVLVAVAKVDLFANETERLAARNHYATEGGAFYDEVKKFSYQVGTDNISVETTPVCSWLEPFTWGAETIESKLDIRQRDAYVGHLLQLLESYSK